MFGELPKLLGRNFITAYFLPVAAFIAINLFLFRQYWMQPLILGFLEREAVLSATLLGILAWLGGIALLVTNYDIYRFFEGYWRFNPLRVFMGLEKKRFRSIVAAVRKLDAQYWEFEARGEEFPADLDEEYMNLRLLFAERFPPREDLILPTAFGNTLRAFEAYPGVMYGFDAVGGWNRLQAVIPGDYRELIEEAKSQVDFWVNVGALSALVLLEYAGLAFITRTLPDSWLLFFIVIPPVVAPWRARRVALNWGDLVKSAFDVYLPKLHEVLELERPLNSVSRKEQWINFSRAIVYRDPDCMPDRARRPKQKLGCRKRFQNL